MAETLTYLGFIDKQIDELTYPVNVTPELREYNRKMKGLIANESLDDLENYALHIMDAVSAIGRNLKNGVSMSNLCHMLGSIEYTLAKAGRLSTSPAFIRFLKKELFRYTLLSQWGGRNMVLSFYYIAKIDNTPLIEAGFGDIKDRTDYYPSEKIFIDYLHVVYRYAHFFLKCDKNGYYNPEERKLIEDVVTNYELFRKYVDTDRKITPLKLRTSSTGYRQSDPTEWVYEKEAKKLCKAVKREWPALAYSIDEVYYRYDARYKIAKSVVRDNPEVQYPRHEEKKGIDFNKDMRILRNSLIKLALIIGFIGFGAYKLYHFCQGHPVITGIVVIFGFFCLVGSCVGPFEVLALWLIGRRK